MDVNTLRQDRKRSVIAYDKFMKLYGNNPNRIFCFMEGKMDDKYYGLRIDKFFETEKEYVCCDGKDNVLYIKNKIVTVSEFMNCKGLFFVDHDFDESIDDELIFETPCYSIENLYVQQYSMEQILKREFFLSECNPNYQKIIELYSESFKQFHVAIKLLNAWIYFQREQERKQKLGKKLNLDVLLKMTLYKFELSHQDGRISIESKYGLHDLKRWFPEAYDIDDMGIHTYIEKMDRMEPSRDFRGKQEFQFFCVFIEKVKELICKCRKSKEDYGIIQYTSELKNISLNLAGGSEAYMANLTSFAETPGELNEYLERMSKCYL